MSKMLITGGAGFIGSQFGYYLSKKGHEVILLDDMSFGHQDNLTINGESFGTFIKDDICSKTFFEYSKNIDYIIHLAGISCLPVCQEEPEYAIRVNVAGTANVLEAARRNNVRRVLFSSTSAVYENNNEYPSSETLDPKPELTYSLSKYQAELLCKSYVSLYGLDVVIARYHNIYGPHQDFKRKSPPFIAYMLKELIANKIPTFFSNGTQKRDYVFIDDVISFNEKCILNKDIKGEILNCCSGIAYSVNDIYEIATRLLGSEHKVPLFNSPSSFWNKYENLFISDKPLSRDKIAKEVNKYSLGNPQKSKEILGWEPKVSMELGLKKNIEYILANHEF